MKTIYLQQSVTVPKCSRINWSVHSERFGNDIQKLILKYDITKIACSNHDYMFNATPSYPNSTETFSFDETNMLMQLMPDEMGIDLDTITKEREESFSVLLEILETKYGIEYVDAGS